MMRRPVILLALAAALGAGIWFGRSSGSAKPEVTDTSVAITAEPTREPRRAGLPVLPRPRVAKSPLPGLAADLVSTDSKIRHAAVAELARSVEPDAQAMLVASRDPDPSIAATAITALAKLYAEGAVTTSDMLAAAADRTHGPRIRTMALNAVGTVPHPDTARMLAELTASGSTGERRAASVLLRSQAPEDAIPALIRALADADEYVRDNALNGLRALSRGRDFGTDAGAWQVWWQARR